MNILVVDDEYQYRLILSDFLKKEGHKVHTAENGEDAMARMAKVKMDFVICDVYMPVMDGLKFHRTIRSIPGYEKMPFLFVSAFSDQHTLDAIKDSKQDAFMQKGRPLSLLRQWMTYLATPEDERPANRPETFI